VSRHPVHGQLLRCDRRPQQSFTSATEEGAKEASYAGLKARARICNRSGSIAETVLIEAAHIGAEAIVLGTAGLTGLKCAICATPHIRADHGVVIDELPSR
jgi:Asp/Glu/hydantoin racemase